MYCPYCRQPVPDGNRFCGACGKPVSQDFAAPAPMPVHPQQELYNQEVNTMCQVVNHFSPMRHLYQKYDTICNTLRRDRGASKAMLIWGLILLCIAAAFGWLGIYTGEDVLGAIFLIAFGIPGLLLSIFGIKKIVNHGRKRREQLEEYQQLATALIHHYQKLPNCPIPAEYTNPDILSMISANLNTAHAITISDSIHQTIHTRRCEKAQDYLKAVRAATNQVDAACGITIHFVIPTIF